MSRLVFALCGAASIALGVLLIAHPAPRTAPVAAATAVASAATVVSSTAPPSATPLPPIPLGYRIQIPRLGIDLPIMEGDIERDTALQQTPENYAFHLPGTAIPGRGANSYLYAHARRGMFITLWNAAVGDEVWISTPDGTAMRYIVSEIHPRVPPDDVSWAMATPPDRLTLQTSTGPSPTDPRFVVIALPG
ncbi:MAG TPA: sortase [Candidatus Acidoferrales bacterium]|nr:sortase [Candidatus Acidoferrales bacterium]